MKIRKFGLIAVLGVLIASSATFGQSRLDVYALTNARIVTVSGATIDKGTVVIRDGLIESVGADAKVPADARVIDATGLTVYPGVIDALTNLGAPQQAAPTGFRGGGGPQAASTPSPTNSNFPVGIQPEKSIVEDLKGGDSQFDAVRAAGFTTALTFNPAGMFNGTSAVIDLGGANVSDMIVRDQVWQHFTFRTVQGGFPGSLLGTFAEFRQMMLDAKRLQSLQKAYAANPRGMRRPENDRTLEALYPVINGTIPVVFNANTENEIVRALDLAKEFGIKAMIAGGQDAWKVADRLKSQNVAVLLSLNFPKRTAAASPEADPETLETLRFRAETPKGPKILADKGVKFAFQSGGLTNLSDFFANAAKATENGLSKDAAIRAMTLGSAEILGIADRTGSVEAGKIANLTVVKGDILSKDRFVSHVFVDGRLFEQKERPREQPNRGPRRDPSSNAASASGNWKIVLDVQGQQVAGTIMLEQSGSAVTGSLVTDMTPSASIRKGMISGDGITFEATVSVQGEPTDITVIGKINGNQINGTIESQHGTFAFSGTRSPQE